MQQLFYHEIHQNVFSDIYLNSVLPIVIKKNFEQNIYFCLLKIKFIFFRSKIQFFRLNSDKDYRNHLSTLRKKFKIFLSILFEKRRFAQDVRWPKASDSPLFTLNLKSEIDFFLSFPSVSLQGHLMHRIYFNFY